ncbi:hypothetical protein BDV23DRAFT_165131, partial [Aspergillus alliaceus]
MLTKRKRLTREVDKGTYNYILFHVMSCFFLPKPLEGLALCSQQVISLERATMTSDLVFPGFYSDIRAFFLWFSLLFPCFCFFSLSLSLFLHLVSMVEARTSVEFFGPSQLSPTRSCLGRGLS